MPAWLPAATAYIEQWLDFQMRLSEQPGCVLAIARSGALVSERAFGVADLATGSPLTPRHRFRVASHSKTFTAAGIMKLREEGRLRLDDQVGVHVAGLTAEVGAVTVAQLLTHSAGLMRDGTDAGHWQDRHPFLNTAELHAQLRERPTLEANTRLKYSNLGYGLLGLLIEAVTGEPYEAWIKRTIVDAAALSETAPDMPLPGHPPMAVGHGGKLPLGRRVPIPGHNPTHALAAATGFVSTAADLARFFSQLDAVAAGSVLSAESRREMARRHWRFPHMQLERHYGLGTISGDSDGHAWFGHSGSFQGFISRTAVVPDWGLAISIVTNAVDGLANQWVDGALHIMHQFAQNGAPDGTVKGWTGRWWSIWGPVDLVPMGRKVLVGNPTLPTPFTDASELTVSTSTEARIGLATGFGSHGEPAQLELAPDGTAVRLRLGGTDLLPEQAFVEEVARRPANARA